MILYFIRHGQAVENPATGEKELTDETRKELETHFINFKALNPKFDIILSSPKVRAKQTADILQNVLESTTKLQIEAGLQFGNR